MQYAAQRPSCISPWPLSVKRLRILRPSFPALGRKQRAGHSRQRGGACNKPEVRILMRAGAATSWWQVFAPHQAVAPSGASQYSPSLQGIPACETRRGHCQPFSGVHIKGKRVPHCNDRNGGMMNREICRIAPPRSSDGSMGFVFVTNASH